MKELNKSAKRFYFLVEELYGDEITISKDSYQNSRTKVNVKCNKHDIVYDAWPTNLVRGSKGCKLCAGKLTKEDFIKKSRNVHGNKYTYDEVKFVNTTTVISITCPIHGDWNVKPTPHYDSRSGCPKCAIERNKLNSRKFIKKQASHTVVSIITIMFT